MEDLLESIYDEEDRNPKEDKELYKTKDLWKEPKATFEEDKEEAMKKGNGNLKDKTVKTKVAASHNRNSKHAPKGDIEHLATLKSLPRIRRSLGGTSMSELWKRYCS